MAEWTAPPVDREEPPPIAGEREALETCLDYQRRTLLLKCAGLGAEDLKRRAAPPSRLSLLGLVRHMTEVERWWFSRNGAGMNLEFVYVGDLCSDADFDELDSCAAEEVIEHFWKEVGASRKAMRDRSLDDTFASVERSEPERDIRWIYLHMIEEYARHNGHADLLRELVDGSTGD